ncbi:carcinoembryonic antigen-related cell adhesion molecule 1 [Brachyistius frenatus]|uniref:carcinoembryonic antigen-related cell adhesion molecule 1 n=1 Tax=Brachyistius frenatus TaxID=100188 RepID=UPI0037E94125
MCSVSIGTSLSYKWLKGNSTVTGDEVVQLRDGNATLAIVSVTRYDQEPFRCKVSNGISYGMSSPVYLNISYGPSNTTMMIMPMKYIYKTGSNITLSCSAESSPPAMIQWMIDGVYLNQFGPHLQLEKVTESQSGNYKCLFHNSVTSRFSSTSAMIRILDPLTAVVVNHTSGPAILHEPFTLRCEVTGSVDSIQWWKNGSLIFADNTTVFRMNNKMLTLNPVQHSDGGDYQCQAFNYVSNMTSSPYTVKVNYGPKLTIIMGPNVVKTGDSVTLSCHATSTPQSLYKWYFNGSLVSNMSEYVTSPLTADMSGKYICMAFNDITGKNSTTYIMLTVVDPIQNVHVEAPMYPAKEGYSYHLTCNVTGPADHVYWMKNRKPLHEDNRTIFSMDNKKVTFHPVKRYDTGHYQCMAMNAVGNMTSPPYVLLVSFGPEKLFIRGSPYAETGRYAELTCFAMSIPPSQYSWWFNGSMVANTSVFTAGPLSLNMSGEYTCMAYNDVTENNSTKSMMLTVIEAIESVMIRNYTIPINSENFTLTCEVIGPYDMIYWMKDNMILSMNHNMNHSMNHNMNYNMNYSMNHSMNHNMNHSMNYNMNYNMNYSMNHSMNHSMNYSMNHSMNHNMNYSMNHSMNHNMNHSMNHNMNYNMNYSMNHSMNHNMNHNMKHNMNHNMNHMNNPATHQHMSYRIEKNMLHFTPVTMYSDGAYRCVANNRAALLWSQYYMLRVNYGPLTVNISGPDSAKEGISVSLTCSADSQPECDFYWFLNNKSMALKTGSVITFSATKKNEGKYTCKARNPVTNITMYQYKTFAVADHASAIHFPAQGSLMLMCLFALSAAAQFN